MQEEWILVCNLYVFILGTTQTVLTAGCYIHKAGTQIQSGHGRKLASVCVPNHTLIVENRC